jgi:hypothetical protein
LWNYNRAEIENDKNWLELYGTHNDKLNLIRIGMLLSIVQFHII